MTILKVTYGNPVASIKGICEHYQISDRTARMIVKELEQERGRYGDYTVLGDGALKRVNFLAFTDYWQFRKMLQDKNARKHVPVYSPQKVARSLGFYGGETYDGSGNPSGSSQAARVDAGSIRAYRGDFILSRRRYIQHLKTGTAAGRIRSL